MQWKPLNVITLGQRESDNINRMITISDRLLIQSACLLVIWDLLNLRHFDHINRMITLSVITLSGLHCNLLLTVDTFKYCCVLPVLHFRCLLPNMGHLGQTIQCKVQLKIKTPLNENYIQRGLI
jgi:hypothetical protein